jgi:uncharacterized protein
MREASPPSPIRPLDEHELATLEQQLDALPSALDPLDVSAVDGFLCGVLVQPAVVPPSQWLRFVTDVEGRPLPPHVDATALHALVRRRHAELDAAIGARRWFDPWVFELEDAAPSECVASWVAGFSLATERFPALTDRGADAIVEPLTLLYRHVDPADLEDAGGLLEAIETMEPPADLAEAVEDLVQATLLLADVARPRFRPAGRGRASAGTAPHRTRQRRR